MQMLHSNTARLTKSSSTVQSTTFVYPLHSEYLIIILSHTDIYSMLTYIHTNLYISKSQIVRKTNLHIYQSPPHRQAIIDNTSTDGRQDKLTP